MRKNWICFTAIIVLFALITGCTTKQIKTDPNLMPETPDLTLQFDKGIVISMDSSRWLITQYHEEGNSSPYVRAIWLKISENTELLSEEQAALKAEDFEIGQLVKVWSTGPIAESYPEQGTAGKISKMTGDETAPAGLIQQQEAIQLALKSEPSEKLWAIKKATFLSDQNIWNVEAIQGMYNDQPTTWTIDATTGDVLPQIGSENEAFRIYAPLAETSVNGKFTVKGEARVFEAMFSWTLEDGHNILANGNVMAEEGAPEWGDFEFEVSYSGASNPTLMLILYVNSAKDGSPEHQLMIPLMHGSNP